MKRHITAFLDKYRAATITAMLLCFAFVSNSQTYQQMFRYGVEENRTDARILLAIPNDTFPVPSDKQHKIHFAGKSDTVYKWSPSQLRWVLFQTGGPSTCENQLITDWSVSWQGAGFNFSVHGGLSDGTGSYQIGCNFYTEDSTTVTLDASDDDKERIDVIYLDETGVHVLKGDTAAVGSALKPTVNADQIELSFVTIAPGSTTPTLTQQIVYNENTGESNVTNTSTTTDANNATNVYIGAKSVNVTNINDPTGGANIDAVYFDRPVGSWNVLGVDGLTLAIKLKAIMPTNANVGIQLGSPGVGTEVIIPLVKTNTATYQQITIPLSAFGNITNTDVTRVRFRYIRTASTANYTGFYLDYIFFVDGVGTPSNPTIAQFTFNPPVGFQVSPSNTQTSPGTWTMSQSGGSAGQYYSPSGWQDLPNIPNAIGDVNGRTKVTNALQYDDDSLFGQDADALNRGWLTSAGYNRVWTNYYITNLDVYPNSDSLVRPLNDSTSGVKGLKDSTGIGFVVYPDYIAIYATGSAGSKFGVSGEDDAAAEHRLIDGSNTYTMLLQDWYSFGVTTAQNSPDETESYTQANQHIILNTQAFGFYGKIDVAPARILLQNDLGVYNITNLLDSASGSTKMVIWDSTTNKLFATAIPSGGGSLNLSYDATNHEVDISGGGTSAVIPLSVADGATEGLASFSATYFDASSGNISPDLTNGLASGSQGGWLSASDHTFFSGKQSALTNSAGLASAISDESGTGVVLFGTSPTITTPTFSGAVTTASTVQLATNATGNGVYWTNFGGYVDSDFTLSDVNTAQSAFPSGYDVWTLQASTTYRFKGHYAIGTGGGNVTVAMGFALSSMTVTSMRYGFLSVIAADGGSSTAQTMGDGVGVASVVVTATSASAARVIDFEGIIRVNAGGTITPQITFSAAPGGTNTFKANSWIEFIPIGANTVTGIGPVN